MRTLTPFEPVPGTVNHLLTARMRPDFKRAVSYGLLALVAACVVRVYGDLTWSSLTSSVVTLLGSVGFVALSVLAVRSVASEVAAVSRVRFGDAHASVVALLLTLAGYTATTLSLLVLLQVPLQRLLVSGAVTGVVLGIAAQQSLANVVAGLVLLLNRPFQVGQEITLRSGALAGPYSGRVLSIGLTYVQLDTEEGVVLLPNSGVLASVVGPRVTSQVVPAQGRVDSTV
ncbi:MAG: mechanosensitive ion channel family protein [Mycobacteriales bacterium]